MKKSTLTAYTLVELLIVVSIIVMFTTIAMVNYFNFRERQMLANTAAELTVYFRSIAQKAHAGDRGKVGGGCDDKGGGAIAAGNKKLRDWVVGELRNVPPKGVITSTVYCYDNKEKDTTTPGESSGNYTYTLPPLTSLKTLNKDGDPVEYLAFDALFGKIYTKNDKTTYINVDDQYLNNDARFILSNINNEKYHYVFFLENGTFTKGCFCNGSTEDCKHIPKC